MSMKPPVSEHGLDSVEIFQVSGGRARASRELGRSQKRGDVLVRQGEMADALYVVVTGRFLVSVEEARQALPRSGPARQWADRLPRRRRAHRHRHGAADSLVLRLGRTEFETLWPSPVDLAHPHRGDGAAHGRRQCHAQPQPDPRPRTIAIIGPEAAASQAFIVGLTRAFRRHNRTMLVRPEMARPCCRRRYDSTEATQLNALGPTTTTCCSWPSRS
jgi:hypothetical protein